MVVSGATNETKVADEVWVATALLHRENPEREDFTPKEIEARAAREQLTPSLRPGVYVHASLHCVANLAPNSARYRMLLETRRGFRRLYRASDPFHPGRAGGKVTPRPEALPERYRELIDWYHGWAGSAATGDPLLAVAGSGRELWASERADAYVRRLREGWE